MEQAQTQKKKWNWNPLRSQLKEGLLSLSSAAVGIGGIALMLDPFIAFTCAAYGSAGPILTLCTKIPFFQKLTPHRFHKKLELQKVSTPNSFDHYLKTLSQRAGLKPQTLLSSSKIKKPYGFFSITGTNIIVAPEQALNEAPPELNHFILAHETAHKKTDDVIDPSWAANHTVKGVAIGLAVGTAVAIFSPVVALPSFIGICVAAGGLAASKLLANRASIECEKRADRNGLYLSREFNGAGKMLNAFSDDTEKRLYHKPPEHRVARNLIRFIDYSFPTHPQLHERKENLEKSWIEVQTHFKKNKADITADKIIIDMPTVEPLVKPQQNNRPHL